MATIDPHISNGTCYYEPGKQAVDSYIPCGNTAYGQVQCCQAGDHCLEDNACFNGEFGVTYLAGCTDLQYEDPSCPYKGNYPDQQWVGLVRCFVSNDTNTDSEEWAPCEDINQPQLGQPSKCACDPGAHTAIITAGTGLPDVAILPITLGDHISFFAGHEPTPTQLLTAVATASTTSTSTSSATGQSSTTFNPSKIPTEFPAPTSIPKPQKHSQSLSTGQKAGIGVGTVIGAFLGVAVAYAIFLFLRRRSRKKATEDVPPIEDQIRPYSVDHSQTPWAPNLGQEKTTDPVHMRSPAWSGHKSELPAEVVPSTVSSRSSTPQPYPNQHQYQAYNPGKHGHYTGPEMTTVLEMPGAQPDHQTGRGNSSANFEQGSMVREPSQGKVFEMPG